jgi:hypothetical protein
MCSFWIKFDEKRRCRYVFEASLWEQKRNRFGDPFDVLLDTGSFNTAIHDELAVRYGTKTRQSMRVSVGGYSGDADIYVLHKLRVGGHVLENVVALAIPFDGELNNHILLGANVLKNWKFCVSSMENRLEVTEQFSDSALARQFPYRYCFDNKGRVMAFQEFTP